MKAEVGSRTDPMIGAVASVVAGVGLHGIKVQQRVPAHQALQLCGAEEVDGRPATQHHETPCKCLKLHHAAGVMMPSHNSALSEMLVALERGQ